MCHDDRVLGNSLPKENVLQLFLTSRTLFFPFRHTPKQYFLLFCGALCRLFAWLPLGLLYMAVQGSLSNNLPKLDDGFIALSFSGFILSIQECVKCHSVPTFNFSARLGQLFWAEMIAASEMSLGCVLFLISLGCPIG